jgi:hypothetical protein
VVFLRLLFLDSLGDSDRTRFEVDCFGSVM